MGVTRNVFSAAGLPVDGDEKIEYAVVDVPPGCHFVFDKDGSVYLAFETDSGVEFPRGFVTTEYVKVADSMESVVDKVKRAEEYALKKMVARLDE